MFCSKCGNKLCDGDSFCQKCGATTNMANMYYTTVNSNLIKKKSMKIKIAVIIAISFVIIGAVITLAFISSNPAVRIVGKWESYHSDFWFIVNDNGTIDVAGGRTLNYKIIDNETIKLSDMYGSAMAYYCLRGNDELIIDDKGFCFGEATEVFEKE